MRDITWQLFCQTGNIEAYLLLKELEDEPSEENQRQIEKDEMNSIEAKI